MKDGLKENVSIEKLKEVYDFYNSFPKLVAKEVTFTVAPSRCDNIQWAKKCIMNSVARRIQYSTDIVAFILTRENHSNGWPHMHGVVWYPKNSDNSLTLAGGRVWCNGVRNGGRMEGRGFLFDMLGRVQIDELRNQKYEGKDGKEWKSWFDYIIKDQGLPWKKKNCIGYGQFTIEHILDKEVETQELD